MLQIVAAQYSLFGLRPTKPDHNELIFVAKVINSHEERRTDSESQVLKLKAELAKMQKQLEQRIDSHTQEVKDYVQQQLEEYIARVTATLINRKSDPAEKINLRKTGKLSLQRSFSGQASLKGDKVDK